MKDTEELNYKEHCIAKKKIIEDELHLILRNIELKKRDINNDVLTKEFFENFNSNKKELLYSKNEELKVIINKINIL